MVLTLKRCYEAINHKLGVDDDEPLDRLSIVDAAGTILYAHPWRWLEARRWALTIPANTDKLCLPADMAQLNDVAAADASGLRVVYSRDYGDVVRTRAQYGSTSDGYSIVLAPYTDLTDAGEVRPHLAFWPTHTAPRANALLAFGSMKWVNMVDRECNPTTNVPLPTHLPLLETLFLELVRAYAAGWSNDGRTDVQAEIDRIQAGPVWQMAVNADMRAFQYMERPRNTSVQMARGIMNDYYGGDPVVTLQ
jgi:hypothetical protein